MMSNNNSFHRGVNPGVLGAGIGASLLFAVVVAPSCGPTIEETPTPTVEPTPTPSPTPVDCGDDCPTPTPSPTPGVCPQELAEGCLSIVSLQNLADENHPLLGAEVKICDAVVTGIDGDRAVYIQEQCGGAYSGIYLYQQGDYIPSTIAIGDKVDVVGLYDEYFGANQIKLNDELATAAVTVTSSGNAMPDAEVITDLASIATICTTDTTGDEAFKWEGCRVTIENVTVTNLDPCDQGNYGVFEVDEVLLVDDDLGVDYAPTAVDTEIESITGIMHYAYDRFRLFPGEGDIALEGGVPTPMPDPACTRIEDLQGPDSTFSADDEGEVKVCDVVVTAMDDRGRFIVQEADGTDYSGIYVYKPSSFDAPEGFAIGDVVDIRAAFTAYDGTNQLDLGDGGPLAVQRIDQKSTGGALPVAVEIDDASTIATPCVAEGETAVDGADAAKYESVRVKVSDVFVTDIDPCEQASFGVFEVEEGLMVDDDFGSTYVPSETGINLTSVEGVLHKAFGAFRLFPGIDGVDAPEVEETPTPTVGEATPTPTAGGTPTATPTEAPSPTPTAS